MADMQVKVIKPHCLHGSSKSFFFTINFFLRKLPNLLAVYAAAVKPAKLISKFQENGLLVFISVGRCGDFYQELYRTHRWQFMFSAVGTAGNNREKWHFERYQTRALHHWKCGSEGDAPFTCGQHLLVSSTFSHIYLEWIFPKITHF